MIHPDKIFGRLGNRMFQMAFLYAKTRELGLDWYVQDPALFEKYRNDIQTLFGQEIPRLTDVIAIHVRRGDYVNNKFYVDLSKTDYYERAMALFPRENFLIFSDDPEWCKQHFRDNNMEICTETDEVKALNLMASCKGIIMANSSYSWWASYLSTARVVAPSVKNWYSDGIERTKCPTSWIRI